MNVIVLILFSAYHLWDAYQVIVKDVRYVTEETASDLADNIPKSYTEILRQHQAQGTREDQVNILHNTLQPMVNDTCDKILGLEAGFYDAELDTIVASGPETTTMSTFPLQKDSNDWKTLALGNPVWVTHPSGSSWNTEHHTYIYPLYRQTKLIGYVWTSLPAPSFYFLFIKSLLSTIVLILLSTAILLMAWKIFLSRIFQSLTHVAERIVQDPSNSKIEFSHPVFQPLEKYLESLHQTWQKAQFEYQTIERSHWMSEISAAISHEVRNPLTTVRGFLQLFQKKTYLTVDDRELLQLMIHELDSSTTLIKDFLDVTRPTTPEFSELIVTDCLKRVIRVMEAQAMEQDVHIELDLFHVNDREPVIRVIQQSFRQILINLIQNAIQSMSSGGQITVTVFHYRTHVKIHIQDQGCGMDAETLKKIDKPFFTTKANGTGLGFPMCVHLMEQMNGHLDVKSQVGIGTLVVLTFPTVIPKQQVENDRSQEIAKSAG